MKHILAENMRRFHTKNLTEDAYTDSQADDRLKQLMNQVFQNVSNSQDVRENGKAELLEDDPMPGYCRIVIEKPGKFLKKSRVGELHVYVDQQPDTLIMKTIIHKQTEAKSTIDWGEGIFADDDAIYEKVVDEALKLARFIMHSKN
jgi:hypothetical protein